MKKKNLYLSGLIATSFVGLSMTAYSQDGIFNLRPSEALTPAQEAQFFTGTLAPVNPSLAGTESVSGNVLFAQFEDIFVASTTPTGMPSGTVHPQHVMLGSRCPTPEDDQNADGIIDAVELEAASGKILIPLDNDLSRQLPEPGDDPAPVPTPDPGDNPDDGTGGDDSAADDLASDYPSSDDEGSYLYAQAAPLQEMLDDLRAADSDPNDSVGKLGSGEELNITQRVVIVRGVSQDTALPTTVATVDDLPAHLTVPIACTTIAAPVEEPPPAPPAPAQ